MENKDLIIEAIQHSSELSPTQRKVLCLFIKLQDNYVISISLKELPILIFVSRNAIYLSIKKLKSLNLIKALTPKKRINAQFAINKIELYKLVELYLKKKIASRDLK